MSSIGALFLGGLALSVGLIACSGSDGTVDLGVGSQPVLGGQATEDCEWPAVVSLGACSGVFVHPRLVVYAAHCGNGASEVRFGSNSEAPDLVVPTSRCSTMPEASLGDGTDLAYCVLGESVTKVEPARILAGCELESLVVGAEVTMVGFGADGPEGGYGTKRAGSSVIAEVGADLLLDSEEVDTCLGDSGGPLFLSREEPDGTIVQRLVGITSAGSESECGTGISHYVNLTEQLEWLEESSGMDVTPCFDRETWAPTPDCVSLEGMDPASGEDDEKGDFAICKFAGEPQALSTCGDAFAADPDDRAPSLELTSPEGGDIRYVLEPGEQYIEFEVSAEAKDKGWGVKEVRFTLVDASGETKLDWIDQIPPYGIPVLRVPPGSFTLVTEATDFAGNTSVRELEIDVVGEEPATPQSGHGCQTSTRPANGAPWLLMALTAVLRGRYGWRRGATRTGLARVHR